MTVSHTISCKTLKVYSEPLFRNFAQPLNTHTHTPAWHCRTSMIFKKEDCTCLELLLEEVLGVFTGKMRVIKPPNFDAYAGLHLWRRLLLRITATDHITHTSLEPQVVVIFVVSPLSFFFTVSLFRVITYFRIALYSFPIHYSVFHV